jgi:XTP/dITP diphosphohydrolase
MRFVLASRNRKKIEELKRILGDLGITLLSMQDFKEIEDIVEDGTTFEENALKKARFVARQTGLPSIADDSGLEVDALGGKPGVRSARYAGERATDEENVKKLLSEMKGLPSSMRKARFVCFIALVFPDGKEYTFSGYVNGYITEKPSGNKGFGYDPVFQPEGFEKTFAEMSSDEKDRLSHRREALEKLKRFLNKLQPYKQNLSSNYKI